MSGKNDKNQAGEIAFVQHHWQQVQMEYLHHKHGIVKYKEHGKKNINFYFKKTVVRFCSKMQKIFFSI